MMKKFLMASMVFLPAIANATILDFEALASNGTSFVSAAGGYTEDGYTLTGALISPEANNDQFYAGSAALFNNTHNGITRLFSSNSSTFDLYSIDLSEIDVNRLGPTSVAFTGGLFGGGSISQSFALDGIFGFETFLFSGFNDLVSVSWTQTSEYHQFDNIAIDVSSVPEPSSVVLLGLGLAGIGFSRKKKYS